MPVREPSNPGRPSRPVAAAVVALVTAALATMPLALAQMRDAASSTGMTLSTATLAAPTNPATAHGTCIPAVSASIVVSWTATASTWADGYEIRRSTTSGGPYSLIATLSGQATTSYTNTPLGFSTTYYYVVRATKGAWRSPSTTQVSRTTKSVLCV